jgi:hypothetical protein
MRRFAIADYIMPSSTVNQIISPCDDKFFPTPQFPLQRQYEALRAFLVDEEPSGTSPAVLAAPRPPSVSSSAINSATTPISAPPSSASRSADRKPRPPATAFWMLAIDMRKRNFSVYDVRRELAAAGHTITGSHAPF